MKERHVVVFSGAGISAESGLNTFRGPGGLWEGEPVAAVATPDGWKRDPARVLRFYNERRKGVQAVQPNLAHKALRELEDIFKVTIITQNIDDLHERAGSGFVMHLHGEILKRRSNVDESLISGITGDMQLDDETAPDGHPWRPHIVWFGEPVPLIEEAAALMTTADLFLLIGTSLQVYPAAGLIHYLKDDIPKYIIDKNIPHTGNTRNIIPIASTATEGMQRLLTLLT